MKQTYCVSGMTCAACSAHVERAVRAVAGVTEVSVSLLTNTMSVTLSPSASPQAVCTAVEKAGYGASLQGAQPRKPTDSGLRALLVRLIVSVCLLLPLMYLTMGHLMWGWPVPAFVSQSTAVFALTELLITAAILLVNQRFFVSGVRAALHRAPNMDTLVALGSGAAFIYSTAVFYRLLAAGAPSHETLHGLYYESSAMIVTLITVGKLLEAYSKGKTTNAIKSLLELAPETARVVRDGTQQLIPAAQVRIGDVFSVLPGERIPVDGTVLEGESSVNEAALTGESLPVDKAAGSAVCAATLNQNGHLLCTATQVGENTAMSKIITLVKEAASSKAPISKIADRVSGIFVPIVLAIAAVTCVVWLLAGESIGFALSCAICVLVISCPCALGLATPVAIMVGSGIGAKHGILFKTASALEAAGKTQIVVLDKTGTVTCGEPVVTDVVPFDGVQEQTLLRVAASLEEKSEHPLSRAVRAYTVQAGIVPSPVSEFRARTGSGVSGVLEGRSAFGGNASLMAQQNVLTPAWQRTGTTLANQGKTPLYFSLDGKPLGLIAVADAVRPDSAAAVRALEALGVRTIMLTGDNRRTADAVASTLGIRHVIADVLPQDKDAVLQMLSQYGKTAMVGDGINDAPALTRADIGIAVGAGTDVAIDAADIVLMKPGLSDVPAAIRLSRQVLTNIRENLFWAFFYNCIGIPLAAGALYPAFGLQLSPMLGAAAMSLSSFCVVMNALRLNLFNPCLTGHFKKIKPVVLPELTGQKEEQPMKKTISIDGMMCEHCAAHVQNALLSVTGVDTVSVELAAKRAVVTLTTDVSDETLSAAVRSAGYTPQGVQPV